MFWWFYTDTVYLVVVYDLVYLVLLDFWFAVLVVCLGFCGYALVFDLLVSFADLLLLLLDLDWWYCGVW